MRRECPKCGRELTDKGKFCSDCGFPIKAISRDAEMSTLHSFYVDVDSGVVLVNGKEVNHVTALSLKFEEGKYSLAISYDDIFKATHLSGMRMQV